MTVIAWDGRALAADRQCNIGGVAFDVTKVLSVHAPDGGTALLAFAGTGSRFGQLVQWYTNGAVADHYPKRPDDDDSVLVVVTRGSDGIGIQRFEATGYPLSIESKCYADGAGRDVALAALHLGLTADQACELAIKLLPSCGGPVDVVRFP